MQRTRWRLLGLCAVIVGVMACESSRAPVPLPAPGVSSKSLPIIGGKPDRRLPAVGGITVRNGDSFCTGTLIARRVVLTAGHCIDAAKRYSAIQFRIELPDSSSPKGYVYHRYDADKSLLSAHPRWNGSVSPGYDVGVVILSTKVDPKHARPMPYLKTAMTQAWVGRSIQFLGYGYIQSDPTVINTPIKYGVQIPLITVRNDRIIMQAQGKSVCHGDSGGPALYQLNNVWTVVGVNSYVTGRGIGNRSACDGTSVCMRTDVYTTYIEDMLKKYGDQGACNTDADCDPCQVCSAQKICQPKTVQPIAKACKPCKVDVDCGAGGKCQKIGGLSRCVQACTSNACCPADFQCNTNAGTLCFPSSGSCPDVSCTQDSDCGAGEKCNGSICVKACQSDGDCATGQKCVNGLCVTPRKRRVGESCAGGEPCEDDLRCYPMTGGKKICSKLCSSSGIGNGSPGTFCNSGSCGFDTQCIPLSSGNGDICLKRCSATSECLSGMQCNTIHTSNKFCWCQQDTDCKRGEVCNKSLLKTHGACAPKGDPCPTDTECKDTGSNNIKICVRKPSANPCGNGTCESARGENCATCPQDCSCPAGQVCKNLQCVSSNACGDGKCDAAKGENCATCPQDCGCKTNEVCRNQRCQGKTQCGNGTCESAAGENCSTCPQDCPCPQGQLCQAGACITGNQCGNTKCESVSGENCTTCPADCACALTHQCLGGVCIPSQKCGNGTCEPALGENCTSCELDCACKGGKECRGGVCIDPSGCKDDSNCPPGYKCIAGQCQPPTPGGEPGPPPDVPAVPDTPKVPNPDTPKVPNPDTPKVPGPDTPGNPQPDQVGGQTPGSEGGECKVGDICDPGLRCTPYPGGKKICLSVRGLENCSPKEIFLQCDAQGQCRLACLKLRGSGCDVVSTSEAPGSGFWLGFLLILPILNIFSRAHE